MEKLLPSLPTFQDAFPWLFRDIRRKIQRLNTCSTLRLLVHGYCARIVQPFESRWSLFAVDFPAKYTESVWTPTLTQIQIRLIFFLKISINITQLIKRNVPGILFSIHRNFSIFPRLHSVMFHIQNTTFPILVAGHMSLPQPQCQKNSRVASKLINLLRTSVLAERTYSYPEESVYLLHTETTRLGICQGAFLLPSYR